ncbi:EAL domain-containing protein [Lutibaculum baratangense]|uniref:EAL domain-containing protein n=1 Tax=Lutibaculum baratangense TaxID=1358440 RepID=UPI0006851757|nr:EAL domain-containing protein [Lutibaculum baratangense]
MHIRKSRSIRTRLAILVFAAVGAAVVLTTLLGVWKETVRYAEARRETTLAVAHAFAAAAAPATRTGDGTAAFAAIRGIADVPGILFSELRSAAGPVLATTGAATRLQSDVEAQEEGISPLRLLFSRDLGVRVPVVSGGEEVGTLALVADMSGLRRAILQTLLVTLLGGATALVVGLAVAARLQRGLTGPLARLTETMSRIRRSHDYRTRLEVESDDEVGILVDGFNTMLGEIGERDLKLARHRQDLEREVDERTRDLKLARDAAEEASAAKSAFLATMSHEIRTPMNGVLVMAELLASSGLPERQQRYADVVARSGQGLLAIINDILDFSKIESGKLELESVALNPADLADEVVTLFAERARSKGLDLAAHVAPDTAAAATGDPVRLNQIIGNLVNNALKFTEAGYVLLTVRPDPERPGFTEFAVHDSGIGIPEDKIGTLFEAFAQADQSTTRRFGGTGLGLAICRRLVEAMGGEFRVTSRVGKGSTFAFSVPLAGEPAAWPAVAGAKRAVVAVGGEATTLALVRYLAAAGYEVAGADERAGARVALAVVGEDAPAPEADVVLRLCPIGAEVAPAGAVALLTKPLLAAELRETLGRVAAGRSLRDAAARARKTERLPQYRGLPVLVADDSPVNREVMVETLSRFGIVPDLAADGLEAVSAVAAKTYALVFMDGSMPELDGFEATRRIRSAEPAGSHVPVVALTAHVVGSEAEAWRGAGMDGVVHKPFTIDDIARCLATHCAGRRTEAVEGADPVEPPVASAAVPVAAPSPAGEAEPPLLSPEMLAQLDEMAAAGRSDFVERVFGLYLEHAPGSREALRAAVGSGDAEAAGKAAHVLKSMSYNIGAARVAALAGAVERAARERGEQPGTAERGRLDAALDATLEAIRRRLAGGSEEPDPSATLISGPASGEDELAAALESALASDELTLVYQPLVDRHTRLTAGVETLLRWDRNGLPVSPGEFIPVAERSGLIVGIGDYVLRHACARAKGWGIDLAVNISPAQLQDRDFPARVETILAETGCDPRRLVLEVTEYALLEDEETGLAAIGRLKEKGIRFALDDFGTGYSSLTYLRRLPFDEIKIDRSFVASAETAIDCATIIHAVVSIGRSLGKKIVAEGIETEGQLRFLSAAGVHLFQGYLLGTPMSPEDIEARLAAEREEALAKAM